MSEVLPTKFVTGAARGASSISRRKILVFSSTREDHQHEHGTSTTAPRRREAKGDAQPRVAAVGSSTGD